MVKVSKKAKAEGPVAEVKEEHIPCVLIAMQHADNRTDRSNATKMAAAEVVARLLEMRLGASIEIDGDFTFVKIPDIPGDYGRCKREVLNKVDIYSCHPGPGASSTAIKLSEKLGDDLPEGVLGWRVLAGILSEMFMRYGITKVYL